MYRRRVVTTMGDRSPDSVTWGADDAADTGRWAIDGGDLAVAVLHGLAGIGSLVALSGLFPGIRSVVMSVASGLVVLVLLAGARWLWRHEPRPRLAVMACLAGAIVIGAHLVLSDDLVRWISRAAGVVMVLLAMIGWRRRHTIGTSGTNPASDPSVPMLTIALAGVALLTIPLAAPRLAGLVAGFILSAWFGLHAAMRAHILDLGDDGPSLGPFALFGRWFRHNGRLDIDRDRLVASLYFEGAVARSQLIQYATLMVFASAIASMGVITDSTAVVIGAMLIAPLMNPMMAMGFALTMGWPRRLMYSSAAVALGIAIALTVSVLLSASDSLTVDLASNSQIASRSHPTVADLVIAVVAGGAGAYARARDSVASSLPGVAIAIALVPPLTVVGITAQHGDWAAAAGTSLLFLTNLVAIVLVGGAVFVVTGVAPLEAVTVNQRRVRSALAAVVVVGLLVIGGLVVNGAAVARDSLTNDRVRNVVIDWIDDDEDTSLISVDTDGDLVTLVVAGPGSPPAVDDLVDALSEEVDRTLRVDFQWMSRERQIVTIEP
ncbi:MAG: DUF389 domain-containing protein [Desertimonas sp.]